MKLEDWQIRVLNGLDQLHKSSTLGNSNIIPASSETPSLLKLGPGSTTTIPDGLLSYSILNDGLTDILVDGVIVEPGIIIERTKLNPLGNLIGCSVNTQLSSVLIEKISG